MAKTKSFKYPTSFKDKQYPEFIRNSFVLKAFPKPEKVFPRIGLKNCEVDLNTIKLEGKEYNKALLNDIRDTLYTVYADIDDDNFNRDVDNITSDLEYDSDDFINNDGSLCANYNLHIENSKKDTTIVDCVLKLKTYAIKHKLKAGALLTYTPKKKIYANDILSFKAKGLKLCFSSNGDKGYWDTATMSMRKISSCMRWNSSHSKSLIGSLVDPYAGLIYISNGQKTKYGTKMFARSVVRLIVNRKKPEILLEPVYGNLKVYDGDVIHSVFSSFITKKTGLVVQNYSQDYDNQPDGYIPYSEPINTIIDEMFNGNDPVDDYGENDGVLSYRDSYIPYKHDTKFFDPKKIKINAKSRAKKKAA